MIKVNQHYLKLQASYLFSDIAKRVSEFQSANPKIDIIKLGIGDVTRALPSVCIEALHKAVDEMASDDSFRGYGPEQGYGFLRRKIADNDFRARGVDIAADEIFVSDGAKCDTGNFQEIFATDITVAIPDPVYPVYVDTNVMAGRTGTYSNGRYDRIVYLDGTRENGFVPELPDRPVDLIYLCYPNNPTGATITTPQLQAWVDYARDHQALILYDAAYETFIRDDQLPHSIFEIPGARDVAIEFRSFSKTAGFTGTRCAYTVVPRSCQAFTSDGSPQSVHDLWLRRHTTKFNGVSYPGPRAAEAIFTDQGKQQVRALSNYYLKNAGLIVQEMTALGFDCIGGENSPYVWVEGKTDSWSFFDLLLKKAGIVCTPGAGFGPRGEGYIRISAFNSYPNVERAMQRIREALKSGD